MADSTFPISSVSAAVSSRAAFHEISEFLKNSEIWLGLEGRGSTSLQLLFNHAGGGMADMVVTRTNQSVYLCG